MSNETTEALRTSIQLIETAECKNTVMTEAAYALGMIHALRITYMMNKKFCDRYAEEVGQARDKALKRIAKRENS